MRLGNLDGRPVLITTDGAGALDASAGGFASHADVFERWDEFVAWAAGADLGGATAFDPALLGPVSPRPAQVFAIGLNYAAHAAEASLAIPEFPTTFTKFPTCLTGPYATVDLPGETVDFEIELVAVISKRAHHVAEADAWSHVAGLAVGQDLSERTVQLRPPAPQFSLGKSFPGFGPTGPWLVTPDEVADRDDLAIECRHNGEVVQSSRTSDLIFSVARIIHLVSGVTPMLPGDVIFTGTPSGVGIGRTPQRFMRSGDRLESTVEGIGTIVTTFA
jgi:2-keto-4-pentenoate hydratase/2-oxohepta-3-ene-1,7-dioic acid hydratase in catechol pathway